MNHPKKPAKWDVLQTKDIFKTPFFVIKKDRVRIPRNHQEHDFYYSEFMDWVNVIAITPDEEIVMTQQYRHAIGQVVMEIPGGVIDSRDTSPQMAAERELLEETGYKGSSIISLGTTIPNPALQNNLIHSFLVRDAVKVQEQQLDEAEDIEIELMKIQDIPSYVKSGKLNHVFSISAIYLALHVY